MSGGRKPEGVLRRFAASVRSALTAGETERAAAVPPAVPPAPAPAPTPRAGELINEGLQQRQQYGVAAAVPLFERAAQLEPNSHLPHFMLGNAATELGDLDAAVLHYERARDLQPNDHVIRYNLGLNHFWRGYIDAAVEELGTACRLKPSYLAAQTAYIIALHNSERVTAEEIAATIREWGARFALHTRRGRGLRPGRPRSGNGCG